MTRAERALENDYSTEFNSHGRVIARWQRNVLEGRDGRAYLKIEFEWASVLSHDTVLRFSEWLRMGLEEVTP